MLIAYLICLLAGAVLISLSLDNEAGLDGEAGNLSLFFSTPFWSFGLTGFGLCGVLMMLLSPPGSWIPPSAVALPMGLLMGWGANRILRTLARAEAELPVQQERIKQVTQQLEADVIAPAESECQTMMAEAKGEAATIVEQGRSQAEGLRDLVESLKRSGDDAKRLFLLQKLEPLLTMLSDTVQPIEVEEVNLIGEREGGMNLSLATLLKQLQESTGLRLPVSESE